ncbi:efflux RND transporter periplasmic adaptor subunit [Desulfonatronovibrio hydrogenovorans]|uniref:efflux RND transporter periplasmic adaptor subunit n=1 Tax=Desulfonatronovibrio hydrogenovorans TaxID=53245 RepID=UPI00054FD112|nr:efflux RND transporter periplasmic adaptor subunit [Desulfonatronovibrio hydrogenovorans]
MGLFEIWRLKMLKVILPVLILVPGLAGCGQDPVQEDTGQRPLPVVAVQEVEMTDVEVFANYPARVHGSRQVEVRSRVEGILKKKLYHEGEAVEKNQVLFIIDPEPYEIAHRRARAELADARAAHDHAQREWLRHSRLYEQSAVSEREKDQALTEFELARARLGIAQAALDDARRSLGYTEVRSPVAGVTGMEDVSEGNLISWGGLLTTMTQNDPVHVRFSLPEKDALAKRGSDRAEPASAKESRAWVEIHFSDGQEYAHKGQIDFMASTIDTATGMVSARAVFPNPGHELMPGQFVRVRVLVQNLQGVALIPEQAVNQGPEGPEVFIIDEDSSARTRRVSLGPVVKAGQVIWEGLDQGDLVVVNGQVALREGMAVRVEQTGSREAE